MKLITVPVKLLVRLVVLPVKLVLATVGVTFKTGYKVGALPVKGSVVAGRALGLKALVVLALGIAGGVAIGRRLGPAAPADADRGGWSPSTDAELAGTGSVTVDETVTVAETADGAVIVDDVVVTEETADGIVVTETVTVEEVVTDDDLDPETAALDAEVAHVLGETPGDDASDTDGDA